MRDFHPQLSLLWGSGGRMFLATMSQTSIMDPKTADNSCERWPASVQMLCWAGSCCFDKLTPGQNPRIWMGSSLPGRTKCTLCLVEAISLQLTRHGYGTPSIFLHHFLGARQQYFRPTYLVKKWRADYNMRARRGTRYDGARLWALGKSLPVGHRLAFFRTNMEIWS